MDDRTQLARLMTAFTGEVATWIESNHGWDTCKTVDDFAHFMQSMSDWGAGLTFEEAIHEMSTVSQGDRPFQDYASDLARYHIFLNKEGVAATDPVAQQLILGNKKFALINGMNAQLRDRLEAKGALEHEYNELYAVARKTWTWMQSQKGHTTQPQQPTQAAGDKRQLSSSNLQQSSQPYSKKGRFPTYPKSGENPEPTSDTDKGCHWALSWTRSVINVVTGGIMGPAIRTAQKGTPTLRARRLRKREKGEGTRVKMR